MREDFTAEQFFAVVIGTGFDGAVTACRLVQALGLAGDNFYAGERNPPYWRRIDGATEKLLLRQTVLEKLGNVNARAGEAGLELYLFDAWRPRAVQAYFHDIWMPQELKRRGAQQHGTFCDDFF